MTYTQARAEAEQRILNGARAYNDAWRSTWPAAEKYFEYLMVTRPKS